MVWRVGQWGSPRRIPHSGGTSPGVVGFSTDSSLLACTTSPRSIQLLDLDSFQQLGVLATAASINVTWIRFAPDGNELAANFGGQAQVWDLDGIRSKLGKLDLD